MAQWRSHPLFPSQNGHAGRAGKAGFVALLNLVPPRRVRCLWRWWTSSLARKAGQIVGQIDMPGVGDELHHFG